MTPIYNKNVLHCVSLSKAGLPGERVGIAIGDKRYIEALEPFESNAGIHSSRFGQALAFAAFRSGELQKLSNEVIKKGSPLNINDLKEGNCANTVYNGITVTIDFIKDETKTVRFFALRSFGESLYESLTDACLEYGYIAK